MADLKAQVDAARAAIKRAIAAAMVRREQSEAASTRLQALLAARETTGADIEAAEHLQAELAMHEQALASAEHDIDTLKTELASMDGLERQADRVQVLEAVRRAHEGTAVAVATLDRVRASIDALETETRLNEELAAEVRQEREATEAAAEAVARARLAELKARRTSASKDGPTGQENDPAPPKKPKRTM